jgi:TP901 family phage tail tape measure protein
MKSLVVGITIGAALAAGFQTVVKGAENKLTSLGDAVQQVESKTKSITTFKQLKSDLAKTEVHLQGAKDKVARLSSEIRKSKAPTSAMRAELGRAKQATHSLTTKLDQQRSALTTQRKAMKALGVSTHKLAQQEAKLGIQLDRNKAKFVKAKIAAQDYQDRISRRGDLRGSMVGTVAIGAAMLAPIGAAIEFESVMADVKKVVDFDTPQQFKQMSKDILDMSTRIPMAASGIGDIVAAAGQAGIARHELTRFASDAAKMGIAFDMSGAQSGSAMTGLRAIFKLNQDQVVSLGDAYNHLSNKMDATASDLLNISNRAGSTAQMFGLSGAQLGALSSTFLALKTPPEVAATGINALLMKLQTADKQSVKFKGALESIGLSATDMKDAIKNDAQGALLQFLEAVDKAEDKSGILFDLFGQEYSDDITKLVGGLDKYKSALNLVGDSANYAGSMQAEYEARSKTTGNNVTLLKNNMNRLGVIVGTVLLPPLNLLISGIMVIADKAAWLAETFPLVTEVVIGLAMGLGVLKIASIGAAWGMTFVSGGAGVLARSVVFLMGGLGKVTTAMRVMGLAMMANPIGLVIAGIALGAGLLIAYWEPVSEFFLNLFDTVAEGWGKIKSFFGGDDETIEIGATIKEPAVPKGKVDHVGDGSKGIGATQKPPVVKPNNVVDIATARESKEALLGRSIIRPEGTGNALPPASLATKQEVINQNSFDISIQQQPGEDAEALAQRVAEIVSQKQQGFGRPEVKFG